MTFMAWYKLFVVCSEESKNGSFLLTILQMIIYAKLQSSRFRDQYGIFSGKSQMSFKRNATQAGSEERRLFSQVRKALSCLYSRKTKSEEHIVCDLFGYTGPTHSDECIHVVSSISNKVSIDGC